MPEVRATLIVEAKDQASAVLNKVGATGQEAGKKAKGGFVEAAEALTGMKVSALAGVAGVTALTGAMTSAIKFTLDWAGSIDKLSRNTGLTTEEASKLAIVAGDVGIEIGTLEAALKSMTKQGLELSIDTLKELATEYKALPSPVDRLAFATKNFGKAAQEMTEILSRSPEELDKLAAAAEKSGKVLSEDAVAAAELFEQNLAQLKDTTEGLMVTFGNIAIPTLNKAGESFSGLTKIIALNTVEMQLQYGAITETEAQLRRLEIATGGVGEAWDDYNASLVEVNERTADNSLAQAEAANKAQLLEVQTAALNSVWQSYGPTVSEAVVRSQELKNTLEPLTGAASDLTFGMGELTTATLFHQAAQGLDADASYALAESMGLINKDAAAAKAVLDELRAQLESGAITTAEYTSKVAMLNDAINTLPSGKVITIEMLQQYTQQFNSELSGQGGTESGQYGGAQGDGYAAGTGGNWMTVPGGHPNDSYMIGLTSGEKFQVIPAGETNTTTTGDLNFYISGGGDPQAIAAEVKRQLDATGRSADRRMRV